MRYRSPVHIRAAVLGVAACGALLSLTLPVGAAPADRATLAGSVPSWATSANFKGSATATDSIGFRVYLGWQNQSQVEAIAKAVSDPASASYRQFLTPQQFRQQFAPSQSQVTAAQSWLRGQGFTVVYTPLNNHYIAAEGTIAQAAAAFGTSFNMYTHDGLTLRSPSSAVSVPTNLAGIVSGVIGLDDSRQNVAIIDAYASPTIQRDLDQWSAVRGMASTNLTQVVAPGTYHHPESGLRQDPQGWYGEETLDVEAVHGMAPGAHIVYVGAPNNFQDLDAALNHVVDRHLASIVTNSYGFRTEALPPGYIKPYNDTILQGVATGIGIYFSSGDNSDESLTVGYRTADWPASSPWVTAVGGTSIGIDANNQRAVETGWGTYTASLHADGTWGAQSWLYGAGGGVSRLFPEPWYQTGTDISTVFAAQGRTGRALPDIAAFGDPNTGYLIGQTQTFPDGSVRYSEYRIGGTSLSSPIIAGIMALADQASGTPHGFANPAFYANPGAFYDVTHVKGAVVRANFVNGVDANDGRVYRLRTFDQGLSLKTNAGYDDITGLGTP